MFHLVITACLAADPALCAPRLLPAGDTPDEKSCLLRGDEIARDWFARHPELMAPDAPDCVATADLPHLDAHEIAPGIWVHLGQPEALSVANRGRIANLGFVIGKTGVAVIDAGGSRAEGEALYAAIRRVTDRPISHLVLTHMHPDHIYGAEVFSEAGATIFVHANLPEAVARRATSWAETIPAQIGAVELIGTKIPPFDQLVDRPTTLSLGAREVTITPVKTAHTDNDLTIAESSAGVLFTGDLVFLRLTPVIDGSLTGWLDWLDLAAPAKAPKLIVPGHGPVQSEWQAALGPTRDYLAALAASITALIDQGRALSEAASAAQAALSPDFGQLADFEDSTARNADTAFSELEWQ